MKKLMKKHLNQKGFTLIELIVVIAIIAILAAVIIPRFTGFTEKANQKATLSGARTLLTAAQTLIADDPTYDPESATVGLALKGANVTDLTGTLTGVTITNVNYDTDGLDFDYAYVTGGKTYTATVDDGILSATVTVS